MFLIKNLFFATAVVLDYVLIFFMWIIIARAVLSWVNPDPYNPIVRFIHNVTEPVFYRLRRFLPLSFGGMDFSPIVVILGIIFLRQFLVESLRHVARVL